MEVLTTSGSGARKVERLLQSLEQTRLSESGSRGGGRCGALWRTCGEGGDRALLAARAHFDGVPQKEPLRIAPGDLHRAWQETSPELHAALKLAARNITRVRQAPVAAGVGHGARARC